jgi:hypothetical protein
LKNIVETVEKGKYQDTHSMFLEAGFGFLAFGLLGWARLM